MPDINALREERSDYLEKYAKLIRSASSELQKERYRSTLRVVEAQWSVTAMNCQIDYWAGLIASGLNDHAGLKKLQGELAPREIQLLQAKIADFEFRIQHPDGETNIENLKELLAKDKLALMNMMKSNDSSATMAQTAAAPAVTSSSSQQGSASSLATTAIDPTTSLSWTSVSMLSIFPAAEATSTSEDFSKDYKSTSP